MKTVKTLRVKEVSQLTGVSIRSIYRWMSQDKFPKQRKFGAQVSLWCEKEVLQWMNTQPQTA
tara:strand:+ start:205 stop:390 length:186 start_codon:yes stop_codon:yes gene_type:complete